MTDRIITADDVNSYVLELDLGASLRFKQVPDTFICPQRIGGSDLLISTGVFRHAAGL